MKRIALALALMGASFSAHCGLLFKSGFEAETALGQPRSCWGTGCWQDLTGTDNGYAWPPHLQGGSARFQLLADTALTTANPIGAYMFNELQSVAGAGSCTNRVLYMELTKSVGGATKNTAATQNVYQITPGVSGQGDLYIRYRLKLQPDLLAKMTTTSWAGRVVTDWKTTGDYRVILSIFGDGKRLYWNARLDNVANGGLPEQIFWQQNNYTVPVPVGEWFKVEVFVHRSHNADGRVWMAANGVKLFDRFGSNYGVNNNVWNRVMPFLNYSTNQVLPAYQWVDDLEIWDTFAPDAAAH